MTNGATEAAPADDETTASDGTPSAAGETPPPRQITDAREMRALTHPVRIALLEVLGIQGPMTATEAGELIGESPTTCSFHLRQLAKYGYVEEAGGGAGRRRPWQLVSRGMRFSGMGDAEQSIAANELSRLLVDRWLQRHDQWRSVQRDDPVWADVTGVTQHVLFLTAGELATVAAEIAAVLDRYDGRIEDPSKRPEGSRAVETVLFTHPVMTVEAAAPQP